MKNKLKIVVVCAAIIPAFNFIEPYEDTVKSRYVISSNIVKERSNNDDSLNNIVSQKPNVSKLDEGKEIVNEKVENTEKRETNTLNVPKLDVISIPVKKELNFKAKVPLSSDTFKYWAEKSNKDRNTIEFTAGDEYSDIDGITCFRGNNMRDSGGFGTVNVTEKKLNKIWQVNIGAIDKWTGVGWNGQPAIVRWDSNVIKYMNIYSEKKEKDGLTEVIYAALDGYVHFLDLEDGSATRDKLYIGAPIKGSLTIDPRGYPILYIGQGINKNGSKRVDFAYRIFSLLDFKKLFEIKGNDNFSPRKSWGAFDSTSIIDKDSDYFFVCGENGLFYSGKLNTSYSDGRLSVSPTIDKYKYQGIKSKKRGIENSIATYGKYGFFSDNDGILQCVDLQNLEPIWAIDVNDDTDSTVVLDEEEKSLSLYTACEMDSQKNGYSYVRKINATDGTILWENKYKCSFNEDVNGGALATPINGKGDIKDLIIFNIARTPTYNEGLLIAFDKSTGKEVWKLQLKNYCWSSPIAVYTSDNKSYIIQSDSIGKTFLIEGITGKVLDTIDLGANVEGSPAAFDDKIVVGTRGGKIIGIEIK